MMNTTTYGQLVNGTAEYESTPEPQFQSQLHSEMVHPERYDVAKTAFYDYQHPLNSSLPSNTGWVMSSFIFAVDAIPALQWGIIQSEFSL